MSTTGLSMRQVLCRCACGTRSAPALTTFVRWMACLVITLIKSMPMMISPTVCRRFRKERPGCHGVIRSSVMITVPNVLRCHCTVVS